MMNNFTSNNLIISIIFVIMKFFIKLKYLFKLLKENKSKYYFGFIIALTVLLLIILSSSNSNINTIEFKYDF